MHRGTSPVGLHGREAGISTSSGRLPGYGSPPGHRAALTQICHRPPTDPHLPPAFCLTRISHQPPTATADLQTDQRRAPSGLLNGLKVRLRRPPVRSTLICKHLHGLATASGEHSGLKMSKPRSFHGYGSSPPQSSRGPDVAACYTANSGPGPAIGDGR